MTDNLFFAGNHDALRIIGFVQCDEKIHQKYSEYKLLEPEKLHLKTQLDRDYVEVA